jgi:MFS family permease
MELHPRPRRNSSLLLSVRPPQPHPNLAPTTNNPRIVMQMVLWQQMITSMHVTYDQLNYGVAFNSAGLALGSFLFIPLARKYGSRPCYILSTGLMAAVSWWSGRMETVGEMYVTNFLSGLAASINETISEITVS